MTIFLFFRDGLLNNPQFKQQKKDKFWQVKKEWKIYQQSQKK